MTQAEPARRLFVAEVKPHLQTLLEFARRELDYHEARGELGAGELSVEQVVGETLRRAYHDRGKRPPALDFRSWLLGSEHRVLARLVDPSERRRPLWSLSLEEPLPDPPSSEDDAYWDFYPPEDAEHWQDLTPSQPATAHEPVALLLEPRLRRAWTLHDRFGLSVPEVAVVLRAREETVVRWIRSARERVEAPSGTEQSLWNGVALA